MFRKLLARAPVRLFSQARPLSDADLIDRIESNYKKMHDIYDRKPQDLEGYCKMLIFRSKNLGMKELDLLIGSWAVRNLKKLSREELQRYEYEIIQMETPDLHKILSSTAKEFAAEQFPPEHFLAQIRAFGESPNWNAEQSIN